MSGLDLDRARLSGSVCGFLPWRAKHLKSLWDLTEEEPNRLKSLWILTVESQTASEESLWSLSIESQTLLIGLPLIDCYGYRHWITWIQSIDIDGYDIVLNVIVVHGLDRLHREFALIALIESSWSLSSICLIALHRHEHCSPLPYSIVIRAY